MVNPVSESRDGIVIRELGAGLFLVCAASVAPDAHLIFPAWEKRPSVRSESTCFPAKSPSCHSPPYRSALRYPKHRERVRFARTMPTERRAPRWNAEQADAADKESAK